MKHLLLPLIFVWLLSSCTTTSNMYYWGTTSDKVTSYERVAYIYYKSQTPESICALIENYQKIINKCVDNESMIPPGICAEYGYILLNPDNEAYFDEYATKSQKKLMSGVVFLEQGKKMLEKEVALYPEARKFLEPIISRIMDSDDDHDNKKKEE